MPPASHATQTRSQYLPLQDKAQSLKDVDGHPPNFECVQRSTSTKSCIDQYLLSIDNGTWSTGQISLEDLCKEHKSPDEILLVFLPKETDLILYGAHENLSKRFNIPASFWTDLALDASGFFGSQEYKDGSGAVQGYNSQFRFLVKQPETAQPVFTNIGIPYCWHRLGFSTYWKSSRSVLLCFDLPELLKDSLIVSVKASSGRMHMDDPFSFYTVLMGDVVEFYNTALWSWRNLIRDIEKGRTSEENPEPDYVLMHEMARHAIHSSEMLAMAIETLTSMIQEHEIFIADVHPKPMEYKQAGKDLRYIITLFKALHLRSKALEERLRNEINLAFNVVAQHDSRIAMRIADATQVDSAAMKTIATLGLVFLPGTFICALFSTTFFNFTPATDTQPQSWNVSEKFWIYWIVAGPVTGATVLFWSIWQRGHARRSMLKRPAR